MKLQRLLVTGLLYAASAALTFAALNPGVQKKVDEQVKTIAAWAADPVLVEACRVQNASISPDLAAMTQEKWRSLTVLDPQVRAFSKNPVGQFLKANKGEIVTEAFVSDAEGRKVAFIAKTSNWSHKGKPKHDDPMAGKSWQGEIEIDESSGMQQLQVAVPVLDEGKPIGSLVVGLSISNLARKD